tara:strand:- start:9283 stop:10251 length:969 start_codon:yes stop_codon:yes gene_type:complete
MIIKILFTLILSVFIFKSCGLPGPTETKVSFPSLESVTSEMMSNDSPDRLPSLYIFNLNGYSHDNQKYFQRTITSYNSGEKSSEISLPNGNWYFYGLVLHYTKIVASNEYLLNSSKCIFQNTNLEGINKDITLEIKETSCKNLMQSSNTQIPNITFQMGPSRGPDYSIKLSFLNTDLYDVKIKGDLKIISKVPTPYINDLGSTTCFRVPNIHDPSKYYKYPYSLYANKMLLPVAMHIQGYLDEDCEITNYKSNNVVFNAWLGKDFDYSKTSIDFIHQIQHPASPDITTRLYWTPPKLMKGSRCYDNHNCESENCSMEGQCVD